MTTRMSDRSELAVRRGVPWRACIASTAAAVLSVGVVLLLHRIACSPAEADCNPAAFLVLPVVALLAGLPTMFLFACGVLLPTMRYLERRRRSALTPLLVIGALPGLVLAVLVLAREGFAGTTHSMAIIAYVWSGLGIPGAVAAAVLHRYAGRPGAASAAALARIRRTADSIVRSRRR